jgi:hypothetical protein
MANFFTINKRDRRLKGKSALIRGKEGEPGSRTGLAENMGRDKGTCQQWQRKTFGKKG